jgi:hypothetical protein
MVQATFKLLLPPLMIHFMAGICMFVVCFCAGFIWLSPLQPLSKHTGSGMHTNALVRLQASFHSLVHLAPFSFHPSKIMPSPRGHPRRGSPWKPRRPSVSPPPSPSSCSSPSTHPEPNPPSPAAIDFPHFDSFSIVPKMSSSSSHLPPNPLVFRPPPPMSLNSIGKIVGEPPMCEN